MESGFSISGDIIEHKRIVLKEDNAAPGVLGSAFHACMHLPMLMIRGEQSNVYGSVLASSDLVLSQFHANIWDRSDKISWGKET